MAGHGITFAADAVNLCEHLTQHSGADVRMFIDEMRQIARLAHKDAKNSSEKFSAVRQTFLQVRIHNTISLDLLIDDLQITKRLPLQTAQVAVDLLNKVADNTYELVICVHKFAVWWSVAETMISTLESRLISADGENLSTIRIDMARDSWAAVQKDYVEYKTSVSNMLHPSI